MAVVIALWVLIGFLTGAAAGAMVTAAAFLAAAVRATKTRQDQLQQLLDQHAGGRR